MRDLEQLTSTCRSKHSLMSVRAQGRAQTEMQAECLAAGDNQVRWESKRTGNARREKRKGMRDLGSDQGTQAKV